jgi:hypothetical protein
MVEGTDKTQVGREFNLTFIDRRAKCTASQERDFYPSLGVTCITTRDSYRNLKAFEV